MKTFLLLFLLSMSLYSIGQTFPLSDFAEEPLPQPGSPEQLRLNNRIKDFSVTVADGQLEISSYTFNPVSSYALPDGDILAVAYGEFGGGLLYKPHDNTQLKFYVNDVPRDPLYKMANWVFPIMGGNALNVFLYRDSLYLMEGLAHMGYNQGAIFRLTTGPDSFTVAKTVDFDDAPLAMTIYNDTIYLATSGRFYMLNGWNKELIFKDLFWLLLFPNSVAILSDRNIYVGMRGGYAKIDLPRKEIKFYKYIH